MGRFGVNRWNVSADNRMPRGTRIVVALAKSSSYEVVNDEAGKFAVWYMPAGATSLAAAHGQGGPALVRAATPRLLGAAYPQNAAPHPPGTRRRSGHDGFGGRSQSARRAPTPADRLESTPASQSR